MQIAAAEFPGQAVRDAPEQHLGQSHVRAQHEQQARSGTGTWGKKTAAEPARHLPCRGDGGHPHQRRLDLEPGLLGPHLQRRVGQRASATGRSSRSAAASSHYVWPNTRYTNSPAYADLGTNIVSGGNRDGWFNIPTRNQVLGSFSYYKDGWGGSHNFKIGGEIFDERFDYERGQDGLGYVPGDVMHILRNGVAVGSAVLPLADRLAQRIADLRRVSRPTRGGPARV